MKEIRIRILDGKLWKVDLNFSDDNSVEEPTLEELSIIGSAFKRAHEKAMNQLIAKTQENMYMKPSLGEPYLVTSEKNKKNQKIINGLLESLTARAFDNPVDRKVAEAYQDYLDMLREELKRITGKDDV